MYDIKHLPGVIELGYTGENEFRVIEINMAGWLEVLPDGVASIVHIRPGETDADAYVATTTMENGILRWPITNGDLGDNEGYGRLEIVLDDETDSKKGKSVIVQSFVRAGLIPQSTETPAPLENFIDQITELKTAAVNAKLAAEDAETGAETAEGNAEAWAVGQRDGVDVGSGDPAYHNNAKYYAAQGAGSATDAANAKTAAETAQGKAETAQGKAEAAQEKAEYAMGKYPQIDSDTGNWETFNPSTQTYTDTGVHAKGDTGTVPDIEVGTVTTLLPGEQATVTRRSGSPDEAPILDFGIPKGDTGTAENIYGNTIDMTENDPTKVSVEIGKKANKVSSATNGNFAALDSNGDLTDSGYKHSDYKTAQTAVSDPSASGTTDEFIATLSQDANGVITPAKKTVQDASQSVHGLMSALDKTKLDNISQSTLREVPVAVASTDWTLSSGVYSATFLTAYVTSSSKEWLVWDSSYDSYAKANISVTKKSGGGGIVLSTTTAPTGTITGTLSVLDNDDGKLALVYQETVLPVTGGGTGQSSVAGVKSAFGITALNDQLAKWDFPNANMVISNVDLNDIKTSGVYRLSGSITNSAYGNYGVLVVYSAGSNTVRQIQYTDNPNSVYTRTFYSSEWTSWEELAYISKLEKKANAVTISKTGVSTLTFNIPSNSRHIIYITNANTSRCFGGIVFANASGNVYFASFYTGSGFTLTGGVGNNKLTIATNSTNEKYDIVDIIAYGDEATVSTT